ncbi:MAG: metal-dependent hydrolase [Bacteroidota bacterium]
MDTLTHTVLGACVGDALAGRRIGKHAMLWGAVANNLPDIDVVTSLWMSQADGLLAHRGFTHSFLFALVLTPLLSYFLYNRYRASSMRLVDWLLLCGSGIFIHLLIDATTVYGTAWFEPFSHYRVAFNLFFVADLLYTLPFFIGALVLLRLSSQHPRRRFWYRLIFAFNLVYVLFAVRNKLVVDHSARAAFEKQGIAQVDYLTTPTPLNNFLWYVVAGTADGYYVGYTSILDTFPLSDLKFVPRNDSLMGPLKNDHEVSQLLRFSNGYYAIRKDSTGTELDDLRFGQVGGWYRPDAPFVFRYSLEKGANNDLVIQRGRMEAFSWDALCQLYMRICSSGG